MKKLMGIPNRTLQLIAFVAFIGASLQSNAHIVGLSWNDIGDNTVRFYGETAHDLDALGISDPQGGSLQIGPWSSRELFQWSGVVTDTNFEELGVDGWAYWDPDSPESSVLGADYYAPHVGDPSSFGDFFYVDVLNFSSGDYLLTVESCCTALDRELGYDYLTASIQVPEPPVFILLGIALCALRIVRKRNDRLDA